VTLQLFEGQSGQDNAMSPVLFNLALEKVIRDITVWRMWSDYRLDNVPLFNVYIFL